MHNAYIALGSNLGDRSSNISAAIDEIGRIVGPLSLVSSLVESTALTLPGASDQPDFLNAVMLVKSNLEPLEIMEKLLEIETKLGRKRSEGARWQARTIDLDLLLVDELVVNHPKLTLPHPEMHKRDFVLGPLAQIAREVLHPTSGKTIGQLLEELRKKIGQSCHPKD